METKTKQSADVPEANKPLESVHLMADELMKPVTNNFKTAETSLDKLKVSFLDQVFIYGEALRQCKGIFVQNGFTIDKDFIPWAIDYTGKSRALIKEYIRQFEHKDSLKNCTGFEMARTMLKNNQTDADGNLLTPDKVERKKSPRLTDSKRIDKIMDEIIKLDNFPEEYDGILKRLLKLRESAETARIKAQADALKEKKVA